VCHAGSCHGEYLTKLLGIYMVACARMCRYTQRAAMPELVQEGASRESKEQVEPEGP
jgi:L-lysine 2,3-aminomutase